MTKIDAAIRPPMLGDGTAVPQPADATGLATLFEGMIGQAIASPGEKGIAKAGAIEGAIPIAAAADTPALDGNTQPGGQPVEVPAQAVAEQLLKALASAVGGHTGARVKTPRGNASPETPDKKVAKEEGKEPGDVPAVPQERLVPLQAVAVPPAPAQILPPDAQPQTVTHPILTSQTQTAATGVDIPTDRSSSALPGQDASQPGPVTLPAAQKNIPTKGELGSLPGTGSQDLLRLAQQLAPVPAREMIRTLVRKADEPAATAVVPTVPVDVSRADFQADATLLSSAPATPAAPSATPLTPAVPSQTLTDHVERHLEVAKDGAWLDQLARDIAQAAGDDGTSLRFRLHPAHLGSMHVEIARDAQGTSVRLTADTEAGRALLSDAQPKLIQEARAQGIRLSEAHVDLGSGGQGPHQRHTPAEPQIKTARLLHREEERDGKPTSGRAERYA